jgi:phosphosulfolactate synthase
MEYAEVSDGSLDLNHDKKPDFIRTAFGPGEGAEPKWGRRIEKIIPPYKWISRR